MGTYGAFQEVIKKRISRVNKQHLEDVLNQKETTMEDVTHECVVKGQLPNVTICHNGVPVDDRYFVVLNDSPGQGIHIHKFTRREHAKP